MKLPKIVFRSSLIVNRKKQVALIANHEQRVTTNQLGFAAIPVLVLLLFGIAAGVLLIQNGVNFLPKADENSCVLRNVTNFSGQRKNFTILFQQSQTFCDDNVQAYQYTCLGGDKLETPERRPEFDSLCAQVMNTQCTLYNVISLGDNKSHDVTYLNLGDKGEYCDQNAHGVRYHCIKDSNGVATLENPPQLIPGYNEGCRQLLSGSSQQAAAPASHADTAGGCSNDETDKCKAENTKFDRCYKNTSGAIKCLYSQNATCDITCQNKDWKCEIVRGEQRCIYPDNVSTCISGDGNPATCKVIVRDGKRISSDAQACNEGWKNFCKVVTGKGCKNVPDGVPDCDGEPGTTSGTAVTGPTTNQPAAAPATTGTTTGTTSTGTGTGTGSRPGQTSSSQTGAAPAANTPSAQGTCGIDANGLSIPCYSIGVFSSALAVSATVDQSKQAVKNFEGAQKILDEQKKSLDKQVADAAQVAQAKLDAFNKSANACISQQ